MLADDWVGWRVAKMAGVMAVTTDAKMAGVTAAKMDDL